MNARVQSDAQVSQEVRDAREKELDDLAAMRQKQAEADAVMVAAKTKLRSVYRKRAVDVRVLASSQLICWPAALR